MKKVYFQRVLSSRTSKQAEVLSYLGAIGCITMAVPACIIGAIAKATDWQETGYGKDVADKDQKLILPLVMQYLTPGDRRNYTDKELINDMIVPLLHQWTKANALFKPPVINQCRTIELKLTKLWHKAVETSLGKGNLARKNEFLHTLDTLFDILTCKCSIQLCSESNCSHSGKRENNSHIDCGCPREKKIPVLELEFIKAQRTKAEGQGSMQMGSIDYSETKKQIANAKKREQIREREQKKKMKSEEAIQREEELCQDVYHFFDIPPINVNATKLSELVDLSLEVLEPPLTTSLTSQELRNLKETPMQVPKWPSHTQSVERCVKMVTEAAGHVYSHERREDFLEVAHLPTFVAGGSPR
ncbi:High-affinity choline transporter 1-like 1 [Homarus americanus]|uniref:High-affinity choline transporter 1-like 1 n=1 Tax=Homarus americanus TaxID=6706 RepID=A0A8J5MVX4_HOMAM|nr:High-affinity choline transporter 1-like 1 [Homarus americanus]